MLQRIQTLYLLICVLLAVMLYFVPMVKLLMADNQLLILRTTGLYNGNSEEILISFLPVIVLLSMIVFLYLLSILLYKWRIIQARLCIFNILLLFGLAGLLYYHLMMTEKKIQTIHQQYCIASIYPVICIILTYMAYKSIRKDEKLVRSADRIR